MGMTIAEKALARASSREVVVPGDYVDAKIDRIIGSESCSKMQSEAMAAGFKDGIPRVWDNERVHIYMEHKQPALNPSHANANKILRELVKKHNIINFTDTVFGVIHQLAAEECAMPGELALGNDSHSCAWGALNCVCCALGEHELAYAYCFGEIWMRVPETIKVVLTGEIPKWNYAKEIILWLAGKYTSSFALDKAIEYTGPAASKMSMSSRLCLTTHTIELGGKFGVFPYDAVTESFLKEHRSNFDPSMVKSFSADADAKYCQEVVLDLSTLEPQVAVPHSFDHVVPVSQVAGTPVQQVMIGSCANGRVEDMESVARILEGKKVAKGTRLIIQPASWKVYRECMHNGILDTMFDAGAQILNPGCHICLGLQGVLPDGETCVSSCTRNFKGRAGNEKGFIYLGGPETAAAAAIAGKIIDPREVE